MPFLVKTLHGYVTDLADPERADGNYRYGAKEDAIVFHERDSAEAVASAVYPDSEVLTTRMKAKRGKRR